MRESIGSDPDGRFERELIGTVGDRIAVERVTWTGGPDGSRAEVVTIRVIEVDADGRPRWPIWDPTWTRRRRESSPGTA